MHHQKPDSGPVGGADETNLGQITTVLHSGLDENTFSSDSRLGTFSKVSPASSVSAAILCNKRLFDEFAAHSLMMPTTLPARRLGMYQIHCLMLGIRTTTMADDFGPALKRTLSLSLSEYGSCRQRHARVGICCTAPTLLPPHVAVPSGTAAILIGSGCTPSPSVALDLYVVDCPAAVWCRTALTGVRQSRQFCSPANDTVLSPAIASIPAQLAPIEVHSKQA
ncbi:unnamed protein product [Protopolystoma xenopodis]|uniref:Uncharacterized protein n=1 Tax=Protopolystoma xenopodis TaxID=117903 RepID=A0A448WKP0_9PLAT|nr:unnamed protein product [Protopolystoma xenopodis]